MKAVAAVRPPRGLLLLSNQQTCGVFLACSSGRSEEEEADKRKMSLVCGGEGGVYVTHVWLNSKRFSHAGTDKER